MKDIFFEISCVLLHLYKALVLPQQLMRLAGMCSWEVHHDEGLCETIEGVLYVSWVICSIKVTMSKKKHCRHD